MLILSRTFKDVCQGFHSIPLVDWHTQVLWNIWVRSGRCRYHYCLQVPETEEDWEAVKKCFWELWQFPNCIGALDGKHVVISPPPRSGALYHNYKHTFSIVLMALVDADMKFLFVDVGRNGRMNDASIWLHSSMREAIESNRLGIPRPQPLPRSSSETPYVIVGDEGFGLKTYLMRPYPVRDLDQEKRVFNYRYMVHSHLNDLANCHCTLLSMQTVTCSPSCWKCLWTACKQMANF